jgi:hypothetical protein
MAKRKRTTKKAISKKEEGPGIQSLDSFIQGSEDPSLREALERIKSETIPSPEKPPTKESILESIREPQKATPVSGLCDITASDAHLFLSELKKASTQCNSMGIYFHNDMDGLNSAMFLNRLARKWHGEEFEVLTSPLEYDDIPNLKLEPDMTYILCDMEIPLKGKNVFRIDHHHAQRNHKEVDSRTFLLSPSKDDYDYPSTTTILASYLLHVANDNNESFFEYISGGPWHSDNFQRMLVLLASVCDNLWHLNLTLDIPLKRWIPDQDEVMNLILISISASLILGDEEKSEKVYKEFFRTGLSIKSYLDIICSEIGGAKNLYDFVMTTSDKAEHFYNTVFFGLTENLDRTLGSIERDRGILRHLDESMPLELRGNREKMMELLKTKGDLSDQHWRRIQFYGREMEKIEAKIAVDEKSLLKLRSAKTMISTEKGPKIGIFIPKQRSRQIKGILASLFYYRGWKNFVIEDRGQTASFGARGFTEEDVRSYLSTLAMGFEDLKDYLNIEKVFTELPDIFKRNSTLGSTMTFDKTYSGGLGGRGLIYGGTLKGKVPWVFSLLEESGDVEQKIKELIHHKELGKALRGLTEGQSVVPTSQALRSKFKYTGWLVIQPFGEKEEASIQYGNFSMVIMNLAGFSEMFRVQLRPIPTPQPPMEHSRFDIGS